MDSIRTEIGIASPVKAGYVLDHLVRIEALGAVVAQLCRSDTEELDPVTMAEMGKLIAEEAGRIISHVEIMVDESNAHV